MIKKVFYGKEITFTAKKILCGVKITQIIRVFDVNLSDYVLPNEKIYQCSEYFCTLKSKKRFIIKF